MSRQFWKEYAVIGRAECEVPVFFNQAEKYASGVWPSFFENELRNNKRELRRERVQIVHVDDSSHVSLFVKKTDPRMFAPTVQDLLDPDMTLGQGDSWPSIQIEVPAIDPTRPIMGQQGNIRPVFEAAKRLLKFYLDHEEQLLGVPRFRA